MRMNREGKTAQQLDPRRSGRRLSASGAIASQFPGEWKRRSTKQGRREDVQEASTDRPTTGARIRRRGSLLLWLPVEYGRIRGNDRASPADRTHMTDITRPVAG